MFTQWLAASPNQGAGCKRLGRDNVVGKNQKEDQNKFRMQLNPLPNFQRESQ